jgi:predicted DNA repair protein MutK
MASGIFAILDDIAVLLDDASVMTKVAAKKTAGLLGDDLAVNAEKATGFHASRELPVIWAITRGSFINKLIILPIAFLLSAFAPWLIVPVLLLGGAYLSYEGVEKVYEWIGGHEKAEIAAEHTDDPVEILSREKQKIKDAVRTDFILSIEIVVISLETVIQQSIFMQVLVVSLIAMLATIGVYGIVALLVRLDDMGIYLVDKAEAMQGVIAGLTEKTGWLLLSSLPYIIKLLSVVGTIAMLLVGGGMYVHNLHWVHDLLHSLPGLLAELLSGLVVGIILVSLIAVYQRLFNSGEETHTR